MKYRSVFDIIGLVMIGLFSLYIVGVVRIGRVVRSLFGREFECIIVFFYGFFVEMYKGYGIDVVIIGGLFDFDIFDE